MRSASSRDGSERAGVGVKLGDVGWCWGGLVRVAFPLVGALLGYFNHLYARDHVDVAL